MSSRYPAPCADNERCAETDESGDGEREIETTSRDRISGQDRPDGLAGPLSRGVRAEPRATPRSRSNVGQACGRDRAEDRRRAAMKEPETTSHASVETAR